MTRGSRWQGIGIRHRGERQVRQIDEESWNVWAIVSSIS